MVDGEGVANEVDMYQSDSATVATADDGKTPGLDPKGDISNPKLMEIWVDSILRDAEIIGMKQKFFKTSKNRHLVRYGIDRDTLKYLGVTEINIDRLYRALFVYSIGFYELLLTITSTTKGKKSPNTTKVMGSVWTVYSILLEFCCKADYQLLISKLAFEHEEHSQSLKDIIERNNKVFLNREHELKDGFKDIRKEYEELVEEKRYYK
jgi:hypothetical protein